ncbi:hypothetical protein N7532_009268 [Penicillium argentinense]|uniref:Uncharacterized protein n=1 Tax=Penicillium argentinense TaxID=1131581 RepID=A0A9W9K2C8_9EURO|nr:uncharacterized protein N7532_009268 [Penicillium argentinense]KAJ5090584.1 hypothetical protein N7532_009268 [Penicillium argentinense]
MSAAPTSAPAQGIAPIGSMPKTEGITPVSNGQPVTQSDGNDGPQANWESELQLVSSLAKLQELERKLADEKQIHELRLFLPEGLLDPLLPGKPAPDSPAQLRTELDRVARDRITRIGKFQSEWRSIEMKPVWSQVESRIKEANGQLIQPSCMWEKDYDVILKGLVEKEKMKEVERGREKDQTERSNLQTSQGEWGLLSKSFLNGICLREEPLSLTAVLTKAGIVFLVKGVKESDTSGVPEWQVSSQAPAGRSLTKLEQAVQDCLNSRKKKWDLSFLLDMISSYADIKQTPCAKCNRLANDVAQLPAIRRFSSMQSSQNDQQIPKFDALHATCA